MQCDNYLPLLSGHLDRANSDAEERRLQKHLRSCRHCRARLAQMEAADLLLREDAPEPPPALTEAIMAQVGREPRRNRRRLTASLSALAAAAAMLALIFSGVIPLPSRADEKMARNEVEAPQDETAAPDLAADGVATYSAREGNDAVRYEAIVADAETDFSPRAIQPDEFADIPVAFARNAASPTAYTDLEPVSAETLIAGEDVNLNDGAVRILTDLSENESVCVDAYLVRYDTFSAIVTDWVGQYAIKISYPTADDEYTQGLVLNIIDVPD